MHTINFRECYKFVKGGNVGLVLILNPLGSGHFVFKFASLYRYDNTVNYMNLNST